MVRASFYPIQGIIYFITHPSLWRKCFCGLLLTMAISLGSLIGFSFLVRPTADYLTFHNCPFWLSMIVSIIFLLIESALTTIIFGLIFLPILLEQVFNHTIKLKGYKTRLLENQAKNAEYNNIIAGLFFGLTQAFTLIISSPLNLIPIIGTVAFVFINGYVLAWGYRLPELIPLRGLNYSQSRSYVRQNQAAFASFGSVAFALELVPLFNWLFIFTNSCGAALWALDEFDKDVKKNTFREGFVDPTYTHYSSAS